MSDFKPIQGRIRPEDMQVGRILGVEQNGVKMLLKVTGVSKLEDGSINYSMELLDMNPSINDLAMQWAEETL